MGTVLIRINAFIVVYCILFVSVGFAEAFDCSGSIIEPGKTKLFVSQKCGAPDLCDTVGVIKKQNTILKVEQWHYDFGPKQFVRILTFEGGRLIEIDLGDYGTQGKRPR